MQIFGVMAVRNEADIVGINVAHHLAAGLDRILVADNGSTDGTAELLEGLSRDGGVRWTSAEGAFRQSELTSALAREAFLQGADWVVPIDADEFFQAPGGDLREVLERSRAGALQVEVVNFIQRREQEKAVPDGLLHMTRRTPRPAGPIDRIEEMVEAGEAAFVEILYPPKHVSRATLALEVGPGNHSVSGIDGPVEATDEIVCLHAPLRARSVLEAKVERARPVTELEPYLRLAWHVRRWRRLAAEGALDSEWAANSYRGDSLALSGGPHAVVFDPRLRDVVAPLVSGDRPRRRPTGRSASPALELPRADSSVREKTAAVLSRMRGIEGWLFEPEATALMAATALALSGDSPHAVVEVGSFCGRSTVVLAGVVAAVSPSERVYAIDPHEGEVTTETGATRFEKPTLEKFERNVSEAGLRDFVQTIPKRSFEVEWNAPISLLFIDGLHDYGNVARDFAHFERWVVPGGYVVFDDYDVSFPGVVAFVDEVLEAGEYRKLLTVGKMIVTQKSNGADGEGAVPRERRPAAPADSRGLEERLARQERGIDFLRGILQEEIARRESLVADRDRMIRDLQAELHEKVAEANRVIRDLQTELHEKVAECNRVILDLQRRLQGLPPGVME